MVLTSFQTQNQDRENDLKILRNPTILRGKETTILNILGTEILEQFQNDLSSNFKLEMTTDHIPGLSDSQFYWFLVT